MPDRQSRTCGRCLFRNPDSGWCPKHEYTVSPEDPACSCFADVDGLQPTPMKPKFSKLKYLIRLMNPETENNIQEVPVAPAEAAVENPVGEAANENVLMKKCAKCGRELPLDTFAPHNRAKDGHKNVCPDCEKEAKASRKPRTRRPRAEAPAKTSPLAEIPDKALVKELRDRGWEVTRKKTIVQEL